MKRLKSIFAIFTLAVFLFPLVESGIHDYKHRNDILCRATKQHLHTAQHRCILCDFANDFIAYPSFSHQYVVIREQTTVQYIFLQNYYLFPQKDILAPRGPPSLV